MTLMGTIAVTDVFKMYRTDTSLEFGCNYSGAHGSRRRPTLR